MIIIRFTYYFILIKVSKLEIFIFSKLHHEMIVFKYILPKFDYYDYSSSNILNVIFNMTQITKLWHWQ